MWYDHLANALASRETQEKKVLSLFSILALGCTDPTSNDACLKTHATSRCGGSCQTRRNYAFDANWAPVTRPNGRVGELQAGHVW